MSNISNINGSVLRVESYGAPSSNRNSGIAPATDSTVERTDSVELSAQARALASQPTPIREDLVASVRDQIARGVYENDQKLDSAITELAKDLAPHQWQG